jgi:hypothetical protein
MVVRRYTSIRTVASVYKETFEMLVITGTVDDCFDMFIWLDMTSPQLSLPVLVGWVHTSAYARKDYCRIQHSIHRKRYQQNKKQR